MSPTKRHLSEKEFTTVKRLRGGGEDDHFVEEEPFFDEDEAMDQIPPDVEDEIASAEQDVLEGTSTTRWTRPPLPANFGNHEELNVQWIDMDVISTAPLFKNPNPMKKAPVGSVAGHQVPVLRAFGVDEKGHSVCIFIHGFTPYAYFAVPNTVSIDSSNLEPIRAKIEEELRSQVRSHMVPNTAVVGVEYIDNHKSIFGYETPHKIFLKISVSLPGLIPTLKTMMDQGVALPGNQVAQFAPFECNVPFVLRYMIDRDISGAGWLTLQAGKYKIRDSTGSVTHCQVRLYFDLLLELTNL